MAKIISYWNWQWWFGWTKITLEQDSKKELKTDSRKTNHGAINDSNTTDNKIGFIEKPQNVIKSHNLTSYDQVDCPR